MNMGQEGSNFSIDVQIAPRLCYERKTRSTEIDVSPHEKSYDFKVDARLAQSLSPRKPRDFIRDCHSLGRKMVRQNPIEKLRQSQFI